MVGSGCIIIGAWVDLFLQRTRLSVSNKILLF